MIKKGFCRGLQRMYAHHSHHSEQGVRTQANAFGSRSLFSNRMIYRTHRNNVKLNFKIKSSGNEVTLLDYGELSFVVHCWRQGRVVLYCRASTAVQGLEILEV